LTNVPQLGSVNAELVVIATTQICFITKLPNELLFKIIDELHPVESTCLGLTCKALYTLHGAKNPKVRLWNYVP